ncbi:MAG TPA: hypothetical protein VKX49_24735 [Bryobacteraceae bacterium]|nr:hypothetical protein [Bryobacteraceae bacterium]
MRPSKIDKAAPSDRSARKRGERLETDVSRDGGDITRAQTSTKSGKHSTVLKLQASRPEFGPGAGAKKVAGAFGDGKRRERSSAIEQAKHKTV